MKKKTNASNIDETNLDLIGDSVKGKRLVFVLAIFTIIGEFLMIFNYLFFSRGISYHRHIPQAFELSCLIIVALSVTVCVIITISGNRVSRIISSIIITATLFYNVIEFFLALALLGAENWTVNVPFFICSTLVCFIKVFYVRNIFLQKHVRAYFYKILKASYGL